MYNLKLMKIKINEEINFSIFNFKTLKSRMISQRNNQIKRTRNKA